MQCEEAPKFPLFTLFREVEKLVKWIDCEGGGGGKVLKWARVNCDFFFRFCVHLQQYWKFCMAVSACSNRELSNFIPSEVVCLHEKLTKRSRLLSLGSVSNVCRKLFSRAKFKFNSNKFICWANYPSSCKSGRGIKVKLRRSQNGK